MTDDEERRQTDSALINLSTDSDQVQVGRKNHYGSKSLRGTQVAALFYTLCESAKLVGVDPHTYLLTATETALATPGTVMLPGALLTVAA